MNIENLLIENDVIEQSQEICKFITDPEIRNRAVANNMAAKTVLNYFTEVNVDVTSGLHNISQVLKFWEISDIYINGAYVDVRLYFDDEELYVPKYHFDNNLLPVSYMFMKIDETMSGATVTGFIKPEDVDTSIEYNDYYKVDESKLVSYYDILDLFQVFDIDMPTDIEQSLFEYFDKNDEEKLQYSQYLLKSEEARLKLADISRANNIFDYISINSVLKENHEEVNNEDFTEEMEEDLELQEDSVELLDSSSLDITEDLTIETQDELIEIDNINGSNEVDFISENLDEEFDSSILDESYEEIFEDVDNNFNTEVTPSLSVIDDLEEEQQQNALIEDVIEETSDNNVVDIEQEPLVLSDENFDSLNNSMSDSIDDLYPSALANNSNKNIIEEEIIEYSDDNTSIEEVVVEGSNEKEENVNEDLIFEEQVSTTEIDGYEEQDDELFNSVENFESNIEELFNAEKDLAQSTADDQVESVYPRKKTIKVLPLLGILVILGTVGYISVSKNVPIKQNATAVKNEVQVKIDSVKNNLETTAMPVETVENIKKENLEELGVPTALPEIEGNLDASILVSNLSVNWEVPVSYVSNVTAKRYLTKVGKILQMNLKTEFLLLSKPPITNKIVVNLEFNKAMQKFKVKDVLVSSGEEIIDKIVINIVNNILNNSYNFNMNVFSELQGSPSLIIRL